MATFNGWNIIVAPPVPATPATVDFTITDMVAVSVSPFTAQSQVQDWQAGVMEASVSLPALPHALAQQWIAFLMAMRGQANVFQFGDPLASAPLGSGSGTPVVDGAGQTGFFVALRGWTPSAARVLLPGDWIQIGYRIYRTLLPATADGSGRLVLSIWPQLRESPADGIAVTLNNTQGLWRLKANERKWSITASRTYGMQFEIREAI